MLKTEKKFGDINNNNNNSNNNNNNNNNTLQLGSLIVSGV